MTETIESGPDAIEGERALPSINARKRKSGLHAFGFIMLLLVVLLGGSLAYAWFQKNKQAEAEQAPPRTDQGDSAPALSFMDTPPPPAPPPELDQDAAAIAEPAGDGADAAAVPMVEAEPAKSAAPVATGPRSVEEAAAQGQSAPRRASLDKGQSSLFSRDRSSGAGGADGVQGVSSTVAELVRDTQAGTLSGGKSGGDQGGMASMLSGTATVAQSAKGMGDRNFLLSKGTALDCGTNMRIDTTVPGMLTCTLTRNVYSDNGKVVLLERGSKVEGEYTTGLQQGQNRIFVLWTRVRTTAGIEIALDSPGTDPLGASGLTGKVNNHFWRRFGAAMMVSIIDEGLAIAAAKYQGEGTTVNLGGMSETTSDLATKILESTVNIAPTLYKHQGDRINIVVARDLDFGDVYALAAN